MAASKKKLTGNAAMRANGLTLFGVYVADEVAVSIRMAAALEGVKPNHFIGMAAKAAAEKRIAKNGGKS